jgi:hypothetical protein
MSWIFDQQKALEEKRCRTAEARSPKREARLTLEFQDGAFDANRLPITK